MKTLLYLLISLCLSAQNGGQSQMMLAAKIAAGSATFTVVQHPAASACFGSATCALTVTSTTAGNLLIAIASGNGGNNYSYSSITGEGGWTHCPSGTVNVTNDAMSQVYSADCAYKLSAAGGVTSLTWNWAGGTPNGSVFELIEVSRSSGSWTYDTGNTATPATCTTCAGPALTLTGSNDYIVQYASSLQVFAAISGSYVDPFDTFQDGIASTSAGFAGKKGTASGSSVNWTLAPADSLATGAVAFK